MNLFLTADRIGSASGGGAVTFHESKALLGLFNNTQMIGRDTLEQEQAKKNLQEQDPWLWDELALPLIDPKTSLTHLYSGTFGKCVRRLKDSGAKVTYTIAAHSVEESEKEFKLLFGSYPFEHLTDPKQWARYSEGYRLADRVIVPSPHSAEVIKAQGISDNPVVIPHGTDLIPDERISPLPSQFTVGYLGAYGPDKGVIYLLQAWKKLNLKDARLVLGGRESTSPYVSELIQKFGGGNIHQAGWYEDTSDFYNSLSLYVQPSVTEGFGIEVLEAQMHARTVLCSKGAGAHFLVDEYDRFGPRNVHELCGLISYYKGMEDKMRQIGRDNRKSAMRYTWDKIERLYQEVWRGM